MVVRELTGGIYFGKPRGFGTNENGEEIGFNTEVYAAYEVVSLSTFTGVLSSNNLSSLILLFLPPLLPSETRKGGITVCSSSTPA
ncbi:hypothetical protein COP2_036206 [Malus domestica]